MSQIEVPKPVAIAVASVLAIALIVGVWLRSGAMEAPRSEPQSAATEQQKLSQEAADLERNKREDGPPRD